MNRSLRILCVDDHEDSCALMSRVLSGEGHDVQTASNATDALVMATQSSFDVALLDFHLPDGNGAALAGLLRERIAWLILVTGDARPEFRRVFRDAGFDDVLLKPFDLATLEATIGRAISAIGVQKLLDEANLENRNRLARQLGLAVSIPEDPLPPSPSQ